MSNTVIKVENLGKRYKVGHQSAKRERYTALRDVISREAQNFVRKASTFLRGKEIIQGDEVEDFWALRNVISRSSRARLLALSAATAQAKARC